MRKGTEGRETVPWVHKSSTLFQALLEPYDRARNAFFTNMTFVCHTSVQVYEQLFAKKKYPL